MLPIRINASDQVHQGFKCESGSEARPSIAPGADGCVRGVAALRGRRCIRALVLRRPASLLLICSVIDAHSVVKLNG
jgi:hypothetical protein